MKTIMINIQGFSVKQVAISFTSGEQLQGLAAYGTQPAHQAFECSLKAEHVHRLAASSARRALSSHG